MVKTPNGNATRSGNDLKKYAGSIFLPVLSGDPMAYDAGVVCGERFDKLTAREGSGGRRKGITPVDGRQSTVDRKAKVRPRLNQSAEDSSQLSVGS